MFSLVISESSHVDGSEGKSESEAGVTESEAGVTESEAGVTESEAGVTESEAGVTESEAGVTESEAGVTESEAGVTVYRGVVWVFANISGLVTFLPDGTLHSINENFALVLFGYSQDQLVGKVRFINAMSPSSCVT